MAYTTGTANDPTALRAAIVAACVAAGWTLTSGILHKGPLAMQVDVQVVTGAGGGTGLRFRGGTGVAAGALTDAAPYASDLGTTTSLALTWPLTYHLFTFAGPDEVYLAVNHNVDSWGWAAWGRSALALPGTGMWFGAPLRSYNRSASSGGPLSLNIVRDGYVNSAGDEIPALFWRQRDWAKIGNGSTEMHMHHGLDGMGWTTGDPETPGPSAVAAALPMIAMLPNAWNSETVLLPIHAMVPRPSNRMSIVATLANARYTRIDNHAPGELLTLGAERWMVMPWVRKNSARRNGGPITAGTFDSGTFGWAVRYEGP